MTGRCQNSMPIKPASKLRKRRRSAMEPSDCDESNSANYQNQQSKRKRRSKWSTDLKKDVIVRVLIRGESKDQVADYYNIPRATVRNWFYSELAQQIKNLFKSTNELVDDSSCESPPVDRIGCNEKSTDFPYVTETKISVEEVNPVQRARSDSGISLCSESSSDIADCHLEIKKRLKIILRKIDESSPSTDSSFQCEKFSNFQCTPRAQSNHQESDENEIKLAENDQSDDHCSSTDLSNSSPCRKLADFPCIPDYSENFENSNISARDLFTECYCEIDSPACKQESTVTSIEPQSDVEEHSKHLDVTESWENVQRGRNNQQLVRKRRSTEFKKQVIMQILMAGETKAELSRYYNLSQSTISNWLNSELGLQIKDELQLLTTNYIRSIDKLTDDGFEKTSHFLQAMDDKYPIEVIVQEKLNGGICNEASTDNNHRVDCLQETESRIEFLKNTQGKSFTELTKYDVSMLEPFSEDYRSFYETNLASACKEESIGFSSDEPSESNVVEGHSNQQQNVTEYLKGDDQQLKRKYVTKWSTDLKKEVMFRILTSGDTRAKVCRDYNLSESTVRTWMRSELGQQLKEQLHLEPLKGIKSEDGWMNDDSIDVSSAIRICLDEESTGLPHAQKTKISREAYHPIQRAAGSDSDINIYSDTQYQEFMNRVELVKIDCCGESLTSSEILSRFEKLSDLSTSQTQVDCHGAEEPILYLMERSNIL